MRREDTVALDTHFLVRRIEVLGLKQGWVADRLGVARKTISRWVTGKVKRVARDNAEEGLRRAAAFPPLLGELRAEQARLELAAGDAEAEARARAAANEAFAAAGLTVRVRTRPIEEHGVGGPIARA